MAEGTGDPPRGWEAMLVELAVLPVAQARRQAAAEGSQGAVRSHLWRTGLFLVLLLFGVVLFFAVGVQASLRPLGADGPGVPIVFLPALAAGLLGFALRGSAVSAAVQAGDDHMAPLGLRTTEMPTTRWYPSAGGPGVRGWQQGSTVVEGHRHGRAVEIRLDHDRYRTTLSGGVAPFHVRSVDGRLTASRRSPDSVAAALSTLSADQRWTGVEVTGSDEGTAVTRRVRGRAASQGLWFDDLWLAERLADVAGSEVGEGHHRPQAEGE